MTELEITLANIIKSNIENINDINEINSESNLKEIGVNSLTLIKIVLAIEEKFEISFDDELLDVSEIGNFENLVSIVESKFSK